MKTSEEFILEVKEKNGEQITRDGRMIRDIEDKELLKMLINRYPGERENIIDIDEYLGEEVGNLPEPPPKTDTEKQFDAVKKSPSFLAKLNAKKQEFLGDISQTAQSVGSELVQGAKDIGSIVTDKDYTLAQKFAGVSGEVAGTAANVIGEGFEGIVKLGLTQESEDKLKSVLQSFGEKIAETDQMQALNNWYSGLDKDSKLVVDSLGGIASFATEVIGLGVGKKVSKPVIDASLEAAKRGEDVLSKVPGKIDEALEPQRQAKIAKAEQELETVVRRITDAVDERDIKAAKETLSRVDFSDAKTYKQMTETAEDDIKVLAKKQDAELLKNPEKYKSEQLGVYEKVGDETVVSSPVQNALDGLENAYKQSGEVAAEARIRQLRQKMDTEGLTVKEINDLAREYGIEFKDRAFTKTGDPKPNYNAENFENTRKGLKQVARDRMPNDVTKELDKQISEAYATRDLLKKIEQEVAKAENKTRNYSLPQKIGRGVYNLIDLATIGTLGGLVSKLNLKAGKSTVNRLELQAELAKNLKKLEKLNEQTDPKKFSEELERYIDEDLSPGLGIRKTIRPDKVAKGMDKEDFNRVVRLIDEPMLRIEDDYARLVKEMGLENATDQELADFLKEVVDEYEKVADRPVL